MAYAVSVGAGNFQISLAISFLYLLLPIDQLVRLFFLSKTKRNPAAKDITFVIDLALFVSVIVMAVVYFDLLTFTPNNPFLLDIKKPSQDEIFITNVMYKI